MTSTLTYNGIIAGTGTLTKIGTGTLEPWRGVNTYTGTDHDHRRRHVDRRLTRPWAPAPGSPTPGRLSIGTATLATTATFTLNRNRGIALTGTGTFSVAAGTTAHLRRRHRRHPAT